MPSLSQALKGRDLSYLRMVAERWGIEFTAPDFRSGLVNLIPALLEPEAIKEMLETLPTDAHDALLDLLENDGRLPLVVFSQRFGEIRKMGAVRRERERPDRNPECPAEVLWYRAFIAQGFFETSDGLLEFIYIPDDWIAFLPSPHRDKYQALGRPASPQERPSSTQTLLAADHLLDHATTLLAALRLGWKPGSPSSPEGLPVHLPLSPGYEMPMENEEFLGGVGFTIPALCALLQTIGVLDDQYQPILEATRTFLEFPRMAALSHLIQGWRQSQKFSELQLVPTLVPDGDWKTDALRVRQTLLGFLGTVPDGTWWSIAAFIAAIKTHHPHYQRPEGSYETFYLRDAATGDFLTGFASWDVVDGSLVHFFISGILYGLGLVDLSLAGPGGTVTAFRKARHYQKLLGGEALQSNQAEEARIYIRSDGRITILRLAPRSVRYLLARFAVWEKPPASQSPKVSHPGPAAPDEYRYRLTPTSLSQAGSQGLRVDHLISLLARHSDGIPPNLTAALKRFERQGTLGQIQQVSILRVADAEVITELRRSRAARFLGELIGPTTIVINPGAEEKILEIMIELGYMAEIVTG